jgi:response regulator RpfG family c-di-GMP phosphodiesterase
MIHRIMLVDDERRILSALRRMLESKAMTELTPFAFKVETFESPLLALKRAEEVPFAVVVSDYRMPEMSGVIFLTQFKALQPLTVRLILSGYADLSALIGAINAAQIHCFLNKPWDDAELRSAVVKAMATYDNLRERDALVDTALMQNGTMTANERELKMLESSNPALARVNWSADGGVMLEPEDEP